MTLEIEKIVRVYKNLNCGKELGIDSMAAKIMKNEGVCTLDHRWEGTWRLYESWFGPSIQRKKK